MILAKNQVQIPKFQANQTSGSEDIANPNFCTVFRLGLLYVKFGFAISPQWLE
jgi:hypothetical protein